MTGDSLSYDVQNERLNSLCIVSETAPYICKQTLKEIQVLNMYLYT